MSLYLKFESLTDIGELPFKKADPPSRNEFGVLNPTTYSDATLLTFGDVLWDYHFDYRAFTEFFSEEKFRLGLRIEKVTGYNVSLKLTPLSSEFSTGGVLEYPEGDNNRHDAAHPERVDLSPLSNLSLGFDGVIHASIDWVSFDENGIREGGGIRTWDVESNVRDALTAFHDARDTVRVTTLDEELTIKSVIWPNFRSLVDSNVLSEREDDPPVIFYKVGPPVNEMGKAGDWWVNTAGGLPFANHGPKVGGAWPADPAGDIPQSVFDAAKKRKSKAAQIESALRYAASGGATPLYLFESDVAFGAWKPAYHLPERDDDPPNPTIREDDYRLGVGDIGETKTAQPSYSLVVYLPDGNFLKFSFPGGSQSGPSSLDDTASFAQEVPWTDGDGYPQKAVLTAAPVGFHYEATWFTPE